MNYLIDEGVSIGKGANCTISLLHHFLSHHNFGEINLVLHADNCSGQNKNRYVMQYLAWRVSTGLNERIEISFMLVGHTKFAPDWCFGLFKQKFRKSKVGCLCDIAKVVNTSSEVNHAELVGREDGTVLVHQYDWAEYHLVFSNTTPGCAIVREYSDSKENKISLLSSEYEHWTPSSMELPDEITPPGLSCERREYL